MIKSILNIVQGWVNVRGGTDGTMIGNTTDRLKVIADINNDLISNNLTNNRDYSFGTDVNMAVSLTDNNLILFRNPSGSGKKALITGIICNTTIVNIISEFKIFFNPTIVSNGTAITPQARHLNNSQPASAMLVTSIPTLTNGQSAITYCQGQNTPGIDILFGKYIMMEPNSSFSLTGNPNSNNRNASITIVWSEL